jgi:large subunit ribosomal protein L6
MSRIGNLPIPIPEGVEINISAENMVTVKGPKGELSQQVDPDIKLNVNESDIVVERPTEQKRHKSMHGLYRSLVSNMVVGVSEGYTIKLELVGVGFRANSSGQQLELGVGFSHPVYFIVPTEITLSTETLKGQNPTITLESNDKQLIGQVASKIRSVRKPEPYKGKGIKYIDEVVRRKAGKVVSAG